MLPMEIQSTRTMDLSEMSITGITVPNPAFGIEFKMGHGSEIVPKRVGNMGFFRMTREG
jgi:hypothetical protein